ncbi:MAG TPA: nickel-dependent lactate racemase [Anaerolineaceae bacterium]
MRRIKMAFGKEGLWVTLPDGLDATIIEPRYIPGIVDEAQAIRNAIRHPINSLPLHELVRPKDRAAIVFSDITRPMPNDRVLPILLDELEKAGVLSTNITLINGLATHRRQTSDELDQMLGKAITEKYRILQHDAWDQSNLVPVTSNNCGRMVKVNRLYLEADIRILTGFIEPHFFAGFSGGPKAVLPGIADAEAVLDNHNAQNISSPNATWGITTGNPIWEEMYKVAASTQPTFLLNVTLNREKQITGVFAGNLNEAHKEGISFVRQHAMQPVPHAFDLVITSNSGYPLDLNLYQAVKGMSCAAQIVKPGGDIIIAADCWDGLPSHGKYAELLTMANSPEGLLDRILTPGFRSFDQWQVQIQAQIQLKANVHVYSKGLTPEQITNARLLPCISIEDTLARLIEQKPSLSVAILPEGPQTIPYFQSMEQS